MFGSRTRRLNVFAQNSFVSVSCLCWVFRLVRSLRSSPHQPVSLTQPSASSTLLTGIPRSPCALPPWSGMSGYLANPNPDTGHEPKLCVDVSDEHTPINLSDSHRNIPHDYVATEDPDVPRHSGASSSSKSSAAASREFPPCRNDAH